MKIPGLTFVILPILCWIFYVNINSIIAQYQKKPLEFIVVYFALYIVICGIEILFFRTDYNSFEEAINDSIFPLPILISYKILKYINNKLTVKL